jgi:trk system potassium uptake protein
LSDERRSRFASRKQRGEVLVLGLGRFGMSLAENLELRGRHVLAADLSPERVARATPKVTQAVVVDVTNAEALRQIGAADFETAAVCIGEDMEASILATAELSAMGVRNVWARAVNEAHARILDKVGAHHVVQPLRDSGIRLAQLVSGDLVEYVPLDAGFSIIEVLATSAVTDRTLAELELRRRFGVTIVCVKPPGGGFTYTTSDTVLVQGEPVVIAGSNSDLERFSAFLNSGRKS